MNLAQQIPVQPDLTKIFAPGMRPGEPAGLRWTLRFLKVPGFAPVCGKLLLRWLPRCRDIRVAPGFRCLCGNIVAQDVSFNDTFLQDYADIVVGSGTSFSYQNLLLTASHDLEGDFRTIIAKSITIGRNVWITSRVTVLGGASIGDGSVIGAGSVVAGAIPSGVFAAGVPAKPVRSLKSSSCNRTQ